MIHALIAALALVAAPADPTVLGGDAQKTPPPKKQERPSALVYATAVADYLRWVGERKRHEINDVWKKAVALFPRGAAIENYPDSVGDPSAKRSLWARKLIAEQLKRDGKKVDDVEAVLLFSGDNGLVQCEVILVVSKMQRRVVGVYQGWWGR
jgi:hypothetical protein